METEKRARTNRRYAYAIGFGIALSAIHNLWLTEITSINGQATLFLPVIGTGIWVIATLFFVRDNWQELDWGDKRVLVPLLVIVASMGLSGIIFGTSVWNRVAPLLMGLSLFAVYVVSRTLGVTMFRAFIPFVIIGAVLAVVIGLLNPGRPDGGLITNYCASAGFLIFGAVVNQGRWQWVLVAVALIGVFFVGTLEAVFVVAILGLVVFVRRDMSRSLVGVIGLVVLLAGIWLVLGYLVPLYRGNHNLSTLAAIVSGELSLTHNTLVLLTSGRWEVIARALQDISLVGHGYSLGIAVGGTVHNLPLIIMHQVGPLAAVAWSFVTIYCLAKTKWKYAWTAIIAMCVFDHYLWTQFAPFWWSLVGVSTASTVGSDRIFRIGGKG